RTGTVRGPGVSRPRLAAKQLTPVSRASAFPQAHSASRKRLHILFINNTVSIDVQLRTGMCLAFKFPGECESVQNIHAAVVVKIFAGELPSRAGLAQNPGSDRQPQRQRHDRKAPPDEKQPFEPRLLLL